MSNAFSKEERVAFETLLEGFNDAEVMSRNVDKYATDGMTMARANDTMWLPQPYVMQSFSGMDQTANFKDVTQLSVPATLGYSKSVPWTMDAKELRDALQEQRLGDSARQKLASDINVAVLAAAATYGGLVVKKGTPTGFDDIATCDALMNEVGVEQFDRKLALSSRDYNRIAGNLAGRQNLENRTETAYDYARIGMVSGFESFKLDYPKRLQAAGGGSITIDTRAAANNFYTPSATSTAVTGEVSNVDNRFQTITVSATAGVVAGDSFTINGVTQCHLISKEDTAQPKTFRVVSVTDGTHLVITPPLISAQGASDAEKQYQNAKVAGTGLAAAAITWLNTVACAMNPFWHKGAIKLLPGSYAVDNNTGASILRGKTDSGIEVVLQKQYDIATMKTRFRVDTLFGVVNAAPEQSGILLFDQT